MRIFASIPVFAVSFLEAKTRFIFVKDLGLFVPIVVPGVVSGHLVTVILAIR
jgi:hypothetical protein